MRLQASEFVGLPLQDFKLICAFDGGGKSFGVVEGKADEGLCEIVTMEISLGG